MATEHPDMRTAISNSLIRWGKNDCILTRPLAASGLSPKTIQKHVDNIWALGPLHYHGDEGQPESFDSTCRKLRRFLAKTAR